MGNLNGLRGPSARGVCGCLAQCERQTWPDASAIRSSLSPFAVCSHQRVYLIMRAVVACFKIRKLAYRPRLLASGAPGCICGEATAPGQVLKEVPIKMIAPFVRLAHAI